MAVALHQRLGNLHVAGAAVRVDIGGGAALDPLDDLQPQLAWAVDVTADEFVLGPGLQATDHQVAAKAQGGDRTADALCQVGDAGEVDDRDEARARIGETVGRGCRQQLRCAAQFLRHEVLKEARDRGLPLRSRRVGPQRLVAVLMDDQFAAGIDVAGLQPRQRFVAHQHQVFDLRLMDRLGRVEAGRAVLDGEEPVSGKEAARRKRRLGQALR